MSKKCPNCNEKIDHLQVSKQIEGSQQLSEPIQPIQWKPPEEQKEPVIYTCPLCLAAYRELWNAVENGTIDEHFFELREKARGILWEGTINVRPANTERPGRKP